MLSAGEYGFCEWTSDTVSRVTPLAQLLWFQVFLFFCPPSPPHSDCFLQVLLCLRDCDISFSVAWISSFSFCFVVRLFPLDGHWLLWLQLLFLRWTFGKASMHAESVPFLMKNRNSLYDERGQIKVTYLSYLIFSKTAVNWVQVMTSYKSSALCRD